MITRRESLRWLSAALAGNYGASMPFRLASPMALGCRPDGFSRQGSNVFSVAADSPRWTLEGQAKVAEYLGQKCLVLDGGAATVKDFLLRDGLIDVDVRTPARRGFFG